ncbi:alpha/beta fold hydrolase [Nocardioides caldifontis]|uniref:alpha/beta fold hydrolase n=1 Tax=Nocardioides caldifontis TaxID=2588938 RepID=UPI0011DFA340|nr:alpha/beta fold hydrolase [Nocardioides caldifontis]
MTARPLLLLHPLGVDHRFWDPVRACLPDAMGDVVVPDLLGHGGAALPPEEPSVEAFADAVEKELDGAGQVDVVGVSLGGLVGQVLAARRPDLVRRLVVADAVAVYPAPMQQMWRERAATVRREGLAAVAEPMEQLWFTEPFRRDAADQVAAVREVLLAGDPEGYARTCEALATADTSEAARSIAAPVLVLCGEQDAPPFQQAVEWFTAALQDVRAEWLPGGHAAAYENPQPFADALARFLA